MASRIGVLGWVTGVLSAVLGALAFGAVLCLWFPAVLTTPALRDVYPMEIVRTTIKIVLGLAFVLGVSSVLLKRRKALGLTGAGLALLATLMGGSEVAVATPVARSNHVGLDWFLLDLFLLSAIFVPIDQSSPRLIVHLLDPAGPDSLAQWGELATAFERKEYIEPYVLEDAAKAMIDEDPKLRERFEKMLADPAFANDPEARREWFYKLLPSFDERLNLLPIYRTDTAPPLR